MSRSRWRIRYTWKRGRKCYELYRLKNWSMPNIAYNRLYPSLHMMILLEQACGGLDRYDLAAMVKAKKILNQTLEDEDNA